MKPIDTKHSEHDANSPDPGESILARLARDAFEQCESPSAFSWPELDLDDPEVQRFGDYEIIELIGKGGMGIVYRARQLSLEREVALKFVHNVGHHPDAVQRFLVEARLAARLNHPGIVPVYEVGTAGELHFLSMPLMRGRSLADRLLEGPGSVAATVQMALQMCEALDYAHRLGLLHLDIKPSNILIDERGAPLIADFGLARPMDEQGGVDVQDVSGTPAYMAPEQAHLREFRLTAATDIYALGCVLFEMLAGGSPHGAGSQDDMMRRAKAGRLDSLSQLRPGLDPDLLAICERCLKQLPEQRYSSVAAVAEDLRRYQAGLAVSVRSPGAVERLSRWLKREPRLAAATALILVAVLVGAGATYSESLAANAERAVAVDERDAAEMARAAEQAQRIRVEHAAALGARLFTRARQLKSDTQAAEEVVVWLRERIPQDEVMQGEVLVDFAYALERDESRVHIQNLLTALLDVMGREYRELVLEELLESGDPVDSLHAAMLAWRDSQALAAVSDLGFDVLLEQALAENEDNPFAWFVAATSCDHSDRQTCPNRAAAEQLVRTDPDNGFAWLVLSIARDGEAAYAALHEAAAAERFDDYARLHHSAYVRAIERVNAPVTPLLASLAEILAPQETPEAVLAYLEASSTPTRFIQRFVQLCHPGQGMPDRAAVRQDCIAIATRLAGPNNSVLSNMAGSSVARRLAPDSPLAQEMLALRARYVFLSEQYYQLEPEQWIGYPLARLEQDTIEHGELEALARRAEFFDLPSSPPPGWEARDRQALLLPEDRD